MWVFGGGQRPWHICLCILLTGVGVLRRDVVFSVFCLPVVGYHLRLSTQPFSDFVSTLCTCFTYSTFKDKNKK